MADAPPSSAILDARVWSSIKPMISAFDLQAMKDSPSAIQNLDPSEKRMVLGEFRDGFALQDIALLAVSAVTLVVSGLTWQNTSLRRVIYNRELNK